jgi:type II secretion system protein G
MNSAGTHSDGEKSGALLLAVCDGAGCVVFCGAHGEEFWDQAAESRSENAQSLCDINGGLKTALDMFKTDCGRFPTTEEGWNVLITPPNDGSLTNWHGPYLDPATAPEDPWGHPYVYRFPGIHNTDSYDLYSPGLDDVSKTCNGYPGSEWLFRDADELLLVIPMLFGFRLVAGIISRELRGVAFKNRMVDWLWFAISILALWIVFIRPRISG